MKPSVQHFEISSNDYKKAQEFYKNVFDWEITEHEGMNYALVSPGGDNSIGGGIGPVMDGQKAMVTFYITVDDIQAYLDKAAAAGANIVLPVTEIPNVGHCALFTDLDGNVIGLYKGIEA